MRLITKLRYFAAQENCDSEEYDAMQEAADRLEQMEAIIRKAPHHKDCALTVEGYSKCDCWKANPLRSES